MFKAAPEGAMVFGDLNNKSSKLAQLVKSVATQQVRADLNLDPVCPLQKYLMCPRF